MTTRALKKLEKELEIPLVCVAASWRQDIAYDFDELATYRFVDALDRLSDSRIPELGLVLFFRGGTLGFADAVIRIARAKSDRIVAVIPTLVGGSATLIALGCDEVVFHPHGALGACDVAPRLSSYRLSGDLYDDIPALGGLEYKHDPEMPARVAHQMAHRRRVRDWVSRRQQIDVARLSVTTLGHDTGVSGAEAREIGIAATELRAKTLDSLKRGLEDELGVRGKELVLYSESDFSNEEVEFEPAFGVTAAIIETRRARHVFERDTGRPDPDTGELLGEWSH